jgi:hypothetical protein
MVKPPPSALGVHIPVESAPLEPPTPKQDATVGIVSALSEFPGKREYMGTIRTASGDEYKVYMPIVYDYACIDMSKPNAQYELGAKSIGIPYTEFQAWAFPDAQLVMNKLSNAIDMLCLGDKR